MENLRHLGWSYVARRTAVVQAAYLCRIAVPIWQAHKHNSLYHMPNWQAKQECITIDGINVQYVIGVWQIRGINAKCLESTVSCDLDNQSNKCFDKIN